MTRRALVIAPQPFFSPRGTPFSVYYRTMVTAELGLEADLLTYGEGQDVDIPGVRIVRIPRLAFLGPIKVGPSWQKLVLDVFIVFWTLGLLIRNRYDFVHAHEEAIFFCRFFKPLFRYKLVYDMHSSLPEQLTNYKFTTARSLIGLFEWLENSALKAADAVITICPELADYAEARVPDKSRHFLIENSIFDTVKLKDPANAGETPDPVPLPDDRPLVVYAGTLESYQGIDILIPAFARAHASCPEALLLIVGGSEAQVAKFRALAAAEGIADDVILTGRVPQVTAKYYNSRASVITSPRSTGTNTPLKIYEQLASGVPLVATRIRSHTQVLTDDVCFLCEPTADGMAAALVAALTDAEKRAAVIAGAKALYEKDYSRPAYEAKMRALLEVIE
ncbi:glycosyltransferase [Oceanibacterium hippocampi]|uniref:Alpha-D-kanosaminyltransferase n=1 Tax=Oceanibacterium hippocampi TaxID=745714 RepID=A0A1Y5T472_9PROT|nr:glycosyltransferase [Oceanibacterium hippocampi]SLN55606.1 Alpha-D-kanosaminyltransferase [Oceanibacterium hippocampi]